MSQLDIAPAAATLYNPATGEFEVQRTPTIFKKHTGAIAHAGTVIWTPAEGKRFRVLGLWIGESNANNIELKEEGQTEPFLFIPAKSTSVNVQTPVLYNGYLAKAANKKLLAIAEAEAGDTLTINVWGTEEEGE